MTHSKIPSGIEIDYDGTDITRYVVFDQTNFTSVANAVPGDATVVCRDDNRVLDMVSMRPLRLLLDGQTMWGGVIGRVGRGNFFAAVDTHDLTKVRTRKWTLTGQDNNIYFDRRVLHDPDHPVGPIGSPATNPETIIPVGRVLREYLPKFIDLPPGMTMDTVDDFEPHLPTGDWVNQGQYWRAQMDIFAGLTAAVYYLDGDMALHFHNYPSVLSPWGFTDAHPDGVYWIGFREGEYDEDATTITTEALVWSGSALHQPGSDVSTGKAIGTQFSRYPDPPAKDKTVLGHLESAASEQDAINRQAQYGLWQVGEMNAGQPGYLTKQSGEMRAYMLVSGPIGTEVDLDTNFVQGYNQPMPAASLSWFAHDVPRIDGAPPVHLKAGHIIDMLFYTQGVTRRLPCRQIRMSFPTLPGQNPDRELLTYVRFDGDFGIDMSANKFLWAYLLKKRGVVHAPIVSTVNNGSDAAAVGARGSFYPREATDGSRTSFSMPFGYLVGTTQVYLNGLLQRPGMEYSETDPGSGVIEFFSPPYADDTIFITCLTNNT